jgi:hypothetical protein
VTARILADLVLGFHFAFIVFALLGGFVVLWKPPIAWLHVPSVVWSAFVNLFSQVCPLTPLENRFRDLAGQAGYEGGFIEHYIARLVYPGAMPERWGLIAGFSVLIWNVLVYTLLVATLRRRDPPSEQRESLPEAGVPRGTGPGQSAKRAGAPTQSESVYKAPGPFL